MKAGGLWKIIRGGGLFGKFGVRRGKSWGQGVLMPQSRTSAGQYNWIIQTNNITNNPQSLSPSSHPIYALD